MAEETTPADEPPAEEPKYDQAFFLDLAAKGKDAWNEWRRDPANKDVRVTFAGIDFSQAPRDKINFEGFKFGDRADFSSCKWRGGDFGHDKKSFAPGQAYFNGAVFGSSANFSRTAFGHGARFNATVFGDYANFEHATFGHVAGFHRAVFAGRPKFVGAVFGFAALFEEATFGNEAAFLGAFFDVFANFHRSIFGDQANFNGASFGQEACFIGTTFGESTQFRGSLFGFETKFTNATFGERTDFTGATIHWAAVFGGTHFKGRVDFRGWSEGELISFLANPNQMDKEARAARENRQWDSWEFIGSRPDNFSLAIFADARFDDEAIFSGRSFEQIIDFSGARFCYPPDFDGAANVARIDFTGASIGFAKPGALSWTTNNLIPTRLRAVRKIAEEIRNHDLERDLYIEERKAERGVSLRLERFAFMLTCIRHLPSSSRIPGV